MTRAPGSMPGRPAIGEWFVFRPTRGRPVAVCCTGYRGNVRGKAGWIETVDQAGKVRSVAPALVEHASVEQGRNH